MTEYGFASNNQIQNKMEVWKKEPKKQIDWNMLSLTCYKGV